MTGTGRTSPGWGSRWLPVIVWAALIFGLSSIPGKDIPISIPIVGWDKVVHAILYGILGALAMRALGAKGLPVWIVWLFCVAYGVSDELHQLFVPGRFTSVYDGIADAVGAAAGIAIQRRIARASGTKASVSREAGR